MKIHTVTIHFHGAIGGADTKYFIEVPGEDVNTLVASFGNKVRSFTVDGEGPSTNSDKHYVLDLDTNRMQQYRG